MWITSQAERVLPRLRNGQSWIPVLTGESGMAVFRRDDGSMYAKCSPPDDTQALDDERRRIAWASGMGVLGAAVEDWSTSDLGACLVTTTVPGVAASSLSSSELARVWPSITETIRALHALPVADCPFERRLPAMFRIAEDVVRRDAVDPDFLAPEQKGVAPARLIEHLRDELPVRVSQEAADLVVSHGDPCLPNIMVDPSRHECTGLIDLGRLGAADRYADLSVLIANSSETWADGNVAREAFDTLMRGYGIDTPDADRLRFYRHLDPLTWAT